MSTYAELGGVPLAGGERSYGWEFKFGVQPAERTFFLSKARAEKIQLGQPTSLVIRGAKELVVEQLTPIELLPGPDEHQLGVRVVDRRWTWSRLWVYLTANVRRVTGERFMVGETGTIETRDIDPEIRYAHYSLYPPASPTTPWHASDLVTHVLSNILQVPFSLREPLPEVEVQDLFIDSPVDEALEAILAYLPGADVFVDKTGLVVVKDTRDPAGEAEVLDRVKRRPQRAGIFPGKTDRKWVRPSKVVVLFDPEIEVKFTHREGATSVRDTPTLVPVAPVPDLTLTLTDGTILARGSIAKQEDLWAAWGAFGYFNEQIANDNLRRFAMKPQMFEHLWGNDPSRKPDPVNAMRARTAIKAWRLMFAVEERFAARLSNIKAQRAAVINHKTGRRAPAEVYCDWIRRPSLVGFSRRGDPNVSAGWEVRDGFAERLEDARSAPVKVRVEDPQTAVIVLDPQVDPHGNSNQIVLGRSDQNLLPSMMLGAANRQAIDALAQWDALELSSTFNAHVVLTVVPGSPNDIRRLHQEEVTAEEAGHDQGLGPPLYTRIFAGIATARFAWSDDLAEEILGAVRGEGSGDGLPPPSMPRYLLIDQDLVRAVAIAAAKRVYDVFRDRPAGGAQVNMDPNLEPTGAMTSVKHSVIAAGASVTEVRFTEVRRPVDIWRYLPASARRILKHVLDEGTGLP